MFIWLITVFPKCNIRLQTLSWLLFIKKLSSDNIWYLTCSYKVFWFLVIYNFYSASNIWIKPWWQTMKDQNKHNMECCLNQNGSSETLYKFVTSTVFVQNANSLVELKHATQLLWVETIYVEPNMYAMILCNCSSFITLYTVYGYKRL